MSEDTPETIETPETEAPVEVLQVDPAGVTPGLAKKDEPKEEIIYLKCRDPECDSMKAVDITREGPPQIGNRSYRCVKCGHTWSLAVGGPLYL